MVVKQTKKPVANKKVTTKKQIKKPVVNKCTKKCTNKYVKPIKVSLDEIKITKVEEKKTFWKRFKEFFGF